MHLPILPKPAPGPKIGCCSVARRCVMALQLRRVVTGHDENGRAVVLIDEIATNLVSARRGAPASVVWTTEGFPVDNNGSADQPPPDRYHAAQRHRVPGAGT